MMVKERIKTHAIITTCFAVLASVSVFSFSGLALAEGTFLLQLGTFESYSEATKKWEDVKSANRDVVGKLDGKISEVMLPSDPAPSFRTQAGPVETRTEAKELCKQLQSRNVDCLIVETAFAATDLAPEMAGELASSPNVVSQESAIQAVPLRTTNEEEQITTNAIAPVESQPISATSSTEAVSNAPQSTSEMPDTVVIEGRKVEETQIEVAKIPEPKGTELVSESISNDKEYYNPNDVKKSGFFRGTFRFNGNRPYAQESANTFVQSEKAVAKEGDDDRSPSFFGRLFGSSDDADSKQEEALNANIKGDIEVAEAIRVPLSSQNEPQIETNIEPLIESSGVDGQQEQPVAAIKQAPHMYWAQISYFRTENIAYAFNEHLKKFLPQQMQTVRIKVTRPFGEKNKKSSLRVGAFYSQEDVGSVCGEARLQGFRCTVIRDVVTDVPSMATSRPNNSRPAKRKYLSPLDAVDIPGYKPPAKKSSIAEQPLLQREAVVSETSASSSAPPAISDTGIAGQWIELGVYESTQAAWEQWKILQQNVADLAAMRSAISGSLSGNGGSKYQLRAGPFATDVDAENACKSVVKQGSSCAVASPF